MKKDNLTVVLTGFARAFNHSADIDEIYEDLLIHPDYPSLLAIGDVLENFNIKNAAYHATVQEPPDHQLTDLKYMLQ